MRNFSPLKLSTLLISTLSINTFSFASENEPYLGSSFSEVIQVLSSETYSGNDSIIANEYQAYKDGKLPYYPVSMNSIFSNGSATLERDAKRTVSERFDYYDRLQKMVHPNGVCVSGTWNINGDTPYSGYLSNQSKGLFIGRISVAMENTLSTDDRGFGFAGKIFPTLDMNEKVPTANFFTVDVLMGTDTPHVLDAKTTNEPDTGFNLWLIPLGFKIAKALKLADENPGFRPLTQIAALKNSSEIKQPQWIRLSADTNGVKYNSDSDFRNEIKTALKDNHGKITYSIEVSDSTKDRQATEGWTKIGNIEINQAYTSYGCDRRLHFSHPKLK